MDEHSKPEHLQIQKWLRSISECASQEHAGYLARVTDPEYQKARAAELARKFSEDIGMEIAEFVMGLSLLKAAGKSCVPCDITPFRPSLKS